ncbi:hypothetical protein HYV86_07705 [Candidatus Woesearchaeota archaeon]|nr:hypothetical protein [Candidatus Woesearchaeota archaeon]
MTYFVLFKRDLNGEKMEKCKGRMMYDALRTFDEKEEATAFALSNLQDTPILARNVRKANDFDPNGEYIVAAYFASKYSSSSYDGSSDSVPTHEVVRTNLVGLEDVVNRIATEKPQKVFLGIEEKLFPSVLDTIHSINQGYSNGCS